ncbi:MAG: hypothetical protein AB1775_02255 [Bacteroidota bacterium]
MNKVQSIKTSADISVDVLSVNLSAIDCKKEGDKYLPPSVG